MSFASSRAPCTARFTPASSSSSSSSSLPRRRFVAAWLTPNRGRFLGRFLGASAAATGSPAAESPTTPTTPKTTDAAPIARNIGGWRDNAFETFCDDALADPRARSGLRAIETRHPELDAAVLLLGFWLATHEDAAMRRAMTRAQLRNATKISERWRWRVGESLSRAEASLRGEDLRDSAPAMELARAVRDVANETARVERAALCEMATSDAWWGKEPEKDTDGDKSELELEVTGLGVVRGASAVACLNARSYAEYLGWDLKRDDWRALRGVFVGCLRARGRVAADDVDIVGANSLGGANSGGAEDDDDVALTNAGWRVVRGAIDPRMVSPRRMEQKAANARYLDARRTLAAETKRWKATCEDYKRARRIVKAARHEVHKSRRAVRVEYR
jgi:hypothetical protein